MAAAGAAAVVPVNGQVEVPLPDWWVEENEVGRTPVYLVTFAALVNEKAKLNPGEELRDPSGMTREEMANAVLDAVANPVLDAAPQRGGRPRTTVITAVKAVTVREKHAVNEKYHGHVALKLSESFCLS